MNKIAKSVGWAGIVNDKIHETREDGSEYTIYAVYTTRGKAKLAYECVRKVLITGIPTAKVSRERSR